MVSIGWEWAPLRRPLADGECGTSQHPVRHSRRRRPSCGEGARHRAHRWTWVRAPRPSARCLPGPVRTTRPEPPRTPISYDLPHIHRSVKAIVKGSCDIGTRLDPAALDRGIARHREHVAAPRSAARNRTARAPSPPPRRRCARRPAPSAHHHTDDGAPRAPRCAPPFREWTPPVRSGLHSVSLRQLEAAGQRAGVTGSRGARTGRGWMSAE